MSPEILRTHLEILRTHLEILRTHLEILRTHLEILRTHLEILWTHLEILRTLPEILGMLPEILRLLPEILRLLPEILRTASGNTPDRFLEILRTHLEKLKLNYCSLKFGKIRAGTWLEVEKLHWGKKSQICTARSLQGHLPARSGMDKYTLCRRACCRGQGYT
jgi:hypothetical protein